MVENIKRMWSKMMDETQRDVLKAISDEFGIVEHYARNRRTSIKNRFNVFYTVLPTGATLNA